jgi:hypothetical protein
MDNLLIETSLESVRQQINHKVNALTSTCEKSSSIACFGHDKDTLLRNLRAFCDGLRLKYNTLGYVFNNNLFYLARKFYITRLSERVSSLNDHKDPLQQTNPLFDVVRYVICHNPGHAPELVISHYRSESTNFTQQNTYLQPDETVIIPLTIGDSHRIEQRAPTGSHYNRYGLSVTYLAKIKIDMAAKWRHKNGETSVGFDPEKVFSVTPAVDRLAPAIFTRRARSGTRQNAEDTNRFDDEVIPANINHESTIVSSIVGDQSRMRRRN